MTKAGKNAKKWVHWTHLHTTSPGSSGECRHFPVKNTNYFNQYDMKDSTMLDTSWKEKLH